MEDNMERRIAAAEAFAIKGQIKSCEPYGSGHINRTFRLICEEDGQSYHYILQQMNREVFKDIPGLMENVKGVTTFLRRQIVEDHGDPDRETLNLVPTKDGRDYHQDSWGDFWRVYLFIDGATCYNLVAKPGGGGDPVYKRAGKGDGPGLKPPEDRGAPAAGEP